jgi:hypothetical protein
MLARRQKRIKPSAEQRRVASTGSSRFARRRLWSGADGPGAVSSDLLVQTDRVFEIAFGPGGVA